ncbi:hypothetical protein G9A89_003238 [Geosiphon pyriformis]|nr:hypothetical protein G9A89_003238 [Geosiphon pyriformis]
MFKKNLFAFNRSRCFSFLLPRCPSACKQYIRTHCNTSHCSQKFQDNHQKQGRKPQRFKEQLKERLNDTHIKWYPIPVGVGIAFIVFQTSLSRLKEHDDNDRRGEIKRQRPSRGEPWQVHIFGVLPLRALSRLWGRINNDFALPTWLREPIYRLYTWVFGCNLEEIAITDLKNYPNLGSFFYRSLKPGVRPIEDASLVSPADGQVLAFGVIHGDKVEQVKGVTYSLSALLGNERSNHGSIAEDYEAIPNSEISLVDEKEFANVNGIIYTLDSLLGEDPMEATQHRSEIGDDATVPEENKDKKKEAIVAKNVPETTLYTRGKPHQINRGNALFFCVVYLAPGDYHRFHSPTNWVVEYRRHFAGELFSVSPYMFKLLPELFVLNERVVLLGRWRYGFFSMVPVGATNVGSIKINFDQVLRTNRKEDLVVGSYTEVSYKKASKLLGGQPLRVGDEMGGFALGSTVVLIFEAPAQFKFVVTHGQKMKYGQALGNVSS